MWLYLATHTTLLESFVPSWHLLSIEVGMTLKVRIELSFWHIQVRVVLWVFGKHLRLLPEAVDFIVEVIFCVRPLLPKKSINPTEITLLLIQPRGVFLF